MQVKRARGRSIVLSFAMRICKVNSSSRRRSFHLILSTGLIMANKPKITYSILQYVLL